MADLRDNLLTDIGNLDSAIEIGEAKSEQVASYIEMMPTIAELPPEKLAQAIYTPSS
jgi:hypothetical protein